MTDILLVCTGNTCRSPMAEAMLRAMLARHNSEVTVGSAGTGAWDRVPVSEGALLVSLEHGFDLSDHPARMLTRDLVKEASLILTMARHHRSRVEELGGEAKVHLLGEFAGLTGAAAEVSDPFGADIEAYRATFEQLETLLSRSVERMATELNDD
jgi:protein-tyrosine-phosphatase